MSRGWMARPSVVDTSTSDGRVLFDLVDRRVHVVNESAFSVWCATRTIGTDDDVISRVQGEYPLDSMPSRDEICGAIQTLRESGLVAHVIGPYRALDGIVWIECAAEPIASELCRILAPLATDPIPVEPDHVVISVEEVERAQPADGSLDLTTRYDVRRVSAPVTRASTAGRALRMVLAEVNRVAIDSIRSGVAFHGALMEIDGSSVAFVGVSNAGKSTLAAQLIERGHRYLTDEVAVVDRDLRVRSYPKSLCIDPGSQELLSPHRPRSPIDTTWDVDPRAIGDGRVGDGGGRLDALVLLRRGDSPKPPTLRRLDGIEAIRVLLEQSFDFVARGAPAWRDLERIAQGVPIVELDFGPGHRHLSLLESCATQGWPRRGDAHSFVD